MDVPGLDKVKLPASFLRQVNNTDDFERSLTFDQFMVNVNEI